MKFKILVTTFVALMMSFYGTQVLAGRADKSNSGKGNTVAVCHFTGNSDGPAFLIDVPGNAVNGHLRHGDNLSLDGSCDGDGPSKEQLDCENQIDPFGTWTWIDEGCVLVPFPRPE